MILRDAGNRVSLRLACARKYFHVSYALALYLYFAQASPNPNHFDATAERGQKIFTREGCATCHTPPLYTNNKLTPD
jgi:cytochrome c2